MRKLTLAEAWEEAARQITHVLFGGLCTVIEEMAGDKITWSMARTMEKAVRQEAERRGVGTDVYLWNTGPSGQRARARWAKKQAAKARDAATKRRKR